jgi:hypothetical protein
MARPRGYLLRRLFLASATATTTACTSLHVEEAPTPRDRVLPQGRGDEIRLTLKNGTEVRMFHPTIVGDSVVGTTIAALDPGTPDIKIAKSDIAEVAVWRTDGGKTTLAIVAGTTAALTILLLATCASLSSIGGG